jgi:hypothetical protein
LLCKRVAEIGLNAEDREKRLTLTVFNNYVRMVAEKHRKVLIRRLAKEDGEKTQKESQKDAQSETDNGENSGVKEAV